MRTVISTGPRTFCCASTIPCASKTWLQSLSAQITTATGKDHERGVNVAFTYTGLKLLGVAASSDAFPVAFVDGMASKRRATVLGDVDASAPERWTWGAASDAIHVMLLLFASSEVALDREIEAQRATFGTGGLREISAPLIGERHADGREHFGFSDGIAQPAIRDERSSEPARRRTSAANDVAAGEFILGYENEYGLLPPTPLVEAASDITGALPLISGAGDFGRNGSYLVMRQLEQDVAGFWQYLDASTRGPKGSNARAREHLAAKIVGRWPSGAPLILSPDADDPALQDANDFAYDADRDGLRCPVGSHMRRANPRDGFKSDSPSQSLTRSNRHRVLRRGRPYGPRIDDVLVADGRLRGLIFICLNSDIERQFEFIHQTWLNNVSFGGLTNEVDPLLGRQSGRALFTIPRLPLRKRLKNVPRFVTTRGGAYFFLPGIRALRYLAALDLTGHRSDSHLPAVDRPEIDPDLGESLQPGEDEHARVITAIIARGIAEQYRKTGAPARRDVHVRAHGCLAATFRVEESLPVHLAQGIFVPGTAYTAWIRFSNSTPKIRQPDAKADVHAMAIKLLGTAGDDPRAEAATHDFILLDCPVFAGYDAAGYLRFVERQAAANPLVRLLAPLALGVRGLLIARRMTSAHSTNPLATRYWSAVPYRLGNAPHKLAVKYSAIPRTAGLPQAARTNRHCLREAMIATLRVKNVSFDFLVQPRTSDMMSVEDSRTEWSEADAPFIKVATIEIPQQAFAFAERDALAENLAFNPWHSGAAHRPLGSVNRTRRVVYTAVAELRRHLNGITVAEPSSSFNVRPS